MSVGKTLNDNFLVQLSEFTYLGIVYSENGNNQFSNVLEHRVANPGIQC